MPLAVASNQSDQDGSLTIWEIIVQLEPAIELALCAPCLFINIYFALRFSKISTFNPNLKIVMILTNITTACIALLRPTLRFIPESLYSVEAGQYVQACVVYFFFYLVQIFTLIMDSKYLIVGFERHIAFKNRVDYERRSTSATKKMLAIFILVIAVGAAIHNTYRVYTSKHTNWDQKLEYAFITERSIISFFMLHVIAGIGWLVGAVTFYQLKIATKQSKYTGKSLSESYQIREISKIVEVLGPLILAYLSALVFCSTCLTVLCYQVYFNDCHVKSALYLAIANAEYISLNVYNIYGIAYMLWKFKQLRQMLYQDICFFIRIKTPSIVEPVYIDRDLELEDHFRILTTHWNTEMTARNK